MSQNFTPLVSVVIPAFNEEKGIARVLQALKQQTYSNFEVIVIDNNSSDRTSEIVQPFLADNRFSLYLEERPGVMNARECGRIHAKGDIIAILDADCITNPDWIEQGIKHFSKKTNTVAVVGPYDYYDANFLLRSFTYVTQALFMRPLNLLMQYTRRGAVMSGGNGFIKKEALEAIGGFDTSFLFYGDDAHAATSLSKVGWLETTNSITVKSSARRYKTLGFFATQKKYNYWNLANLFNRTTDRSHTVENIHPR